MNMYKLTYESDEELGPTGDATKKVTPDVNENTADETVIYDRSSSREEKGKDFRPKERSDTTASAIASAFAGTDCLPENHKEKQRRRNFYAMFQTIKDDDSDYPKKHSRGWIGCKECMLIFYLFILSMGVVVLAVFFQTLSWKYHLIENRVSFLEEKVSVLSTSGSAGAPAALEFPPPALHTSGLEGNPKVPPIPNDQSQNGGCCSQLTSRIDYVESKLSGVGVSVAARLEQVVEMAFTESKKNFTRLSGATKSLSKRLDAVANQANHLAMEIGKLHSAELETNGMASLALSKAGKGGSGSRLSTAFDAYQAKQDLNTDMTGLIYTLSPIAGIARPLFYNYEMINRREMNPETGAYTAPRAGTYVFFVSFCTAVGDNSATVALTSNGTALEVFSAPVLSDLAAALRSAMPPMPVELMEDALAGSGVEEVKKHSYTVIKRLTEGQDVNLELKEGRIVELVDTTQKNTACTRFSGFRVN